MKKIPSLYLFLFGIAFFVNSCTNNNSPTDSQKPSAAKGAESNKVLFSIEDHKNEISSLVQKATDFNTMLNEMDSFAVAYECDSLQKMEILDASIGVFNVRLSDSTAFLKSVMEYLATNKTRLVPKNYLESLLLNYVRLGDYYNINKVYQYKKVHYTNALPDMYKYENREPFYSSWGHSGIYLSGMAKLSTQKLEAGEMLFKKALLLRQLQMDAIYLVNPIHESTVYKKMFAETYKKYPQSSYADDAAFAEIEDCVSRPEGCAPPYIVYECMKKKERLLSLYPDSDIMDRILASLIADYSFCYDCESYDSHDDSPAQITKKSKDYIKKGISCLNKLKQGFPSLPSKRLDSLENLLKNAEERMLWEITVQPNKEIYKKGEDIKLHVTFNWPSDANFSGDVLGYKGLAAINAYIQEKRLNLIQEYYEVESLQTVKRLKPGESFKETMTIVPEGSSQKKNRSIEMNLVPGKHKISISYLFDHYDYVEVIAKKVEITIQ